MPTCATATANFLEAAVLYMEAGGWKSIKMVERYTHVNPDHLRSVFDALPDGAKSVLSGLDKALTARTV